MSSNHPKAADIGRHGSARWAYPHDLSSVRAEGRIVGYCDAPQVLIETASGEQVWWRADLTLVDDTPRAEQGAEGEGVRHG